MEMKWTYLLLAGTFMFLSTFIACTNETGGQNLSNELKQVVVTVKDFIPEADSRAFNLVNNSVEFAWEDGDTIGIFPNTGAQAYFPILPESAGTNTASFTGGGWALKSSSTYAAYYPFVGNFYISPKEIPVCYGGQRQTGNASMTHLNTHDFMAASGSTPSSGKVNFHFAHLGAFAQLKITMPQGGTLTSVTLSADEAVFTTEGTIDLTATTPAIKSVKKSKTLKLDVENVTTTPESNVATLYMMLAPVDFTSRTLSAIVETSDGKSETITLTGKNFEAGKAYGVSGTMKDPNGGAVAGNGTYKDGVVSVDVAGNMKKLLGDDYLNITSLKVVGPINGDDVYYLRKMLGGSNFSEADWGKLTTLDLSEATIVEGGEWYYEDYPNKYYTMNDVIGENMFSWCKNLKDITLPNSAITIDEDSFYGCTTLTSVIVGNNTTSIGNGAFNYCISLTSIIIGNNVMTIGDYVFFNCPLTSITIGSRVTSIGKEVFYGANFESITIPDSVISIGEKAFWNCPKLTSITIGNSISSIGYDAFYGCDNLRNVCIKDLSAWCNIEFSSYRANPLFYGGKLYLDNKELTELVIPNGISKINSHSFNGCKELKKVIIHDNVTSIGYGAFSSCLDLTFVSIGKSVKEIREWAFNNTPLSKLYCYATTPPSDYGHNFQHLLGKDATLYVPARCGSTYKSKWGEYFKNIVEMD